MTKAFWLLIAAAAVSIYFTDLSSESFFYAAALPLLSMVLAIAVLVVLFASLFQKEHANEYQVHVSVDKSETRLPDQVASDVAATERVSKKDVGKIVSTRTIKYVDGKKIEDSYNEKSS